jgi:hypothetical protein
MTHTRKINYLIWKKTKYPTFFFYRIWRRKKPAKKCSQNWVKGKPFDAEIPPPTNILLEYIYYRTSPFFLSFPTFFPLPPLIQFNCCCSTKYRSIVKRQIHDEALHPSGQNKTKSEPPLIKKVKIWVKNDFFFEKLATQTRFQKVTFCTCRPLWRQILRSLFRIKFRLFRPILLNNNEGQVSKEPFPLTFLTFLLS